jgi:hypothetical protein
MYFYRKFYNFNSFLFGFKSVNINIFWRNKGSSTFTAGYTGSPKSTKAFKVFEFLVSVPTDLVGRLHNCLWHYRSDGKESI